METQVAKAGFTMRRSRISPSRKHPRASESRLVRIDALLDYTDGQIRDVSRSYESQLRTRRIPLELCIKIKNCCENLRSALDYFAHHIFEVTYPGEPLPARLEFPLLWKREERTSGIHKQFPDLRSINRNLWEEIESFQPYKRDNKWLRRFVRVVNDHKHWDLVAQSIHTVPEGEANRLGPVVYWLEDERVWIEYRFRGIRTNAFFLLEQAHTNIRYFIEETPWHLP